MRDEVWAWVPRDHEGRITAAAAEVFYEARGLARRLDAELVAVTDRKPDSRANALLKAWRIKEVRTLKHTAAPHPLFDGEALPLRELDPANPPRVFLLAADTFGRVAAPLWAGDCVSGLVTGATGVTADSANYVVARPAMGEQFESLEYMPLNEPLVVTLAPGAVGNAAPPEPPGVEPASEVAKGKVKAAEFRIHPPHPGTLDIADAERIVAFGRGAFTTEAISLVERLADRLGAAVAGTRPAADEGWLPFSRQVGLTGAIVRPRLYVAVGISGAPYHMVGVKDPEFLVAVNSDAGAPIFGSASLAIVGDLYEVLPKLIDEIGPRGEWKEAGTAPARRRG